MKSSLFTFVIESNVPSINNDAENSIRKCVMQRKVRDQVKSKSGMIAVFDLGGGTFDISILEILTIVHNGAIDAVIRSS